MSSEAQRVYLMERMLANLGRFSFPIALPNQPFDAPKNATYGEFHILSGPKSVVIGGEGRGRARVRYVGSVQLTIWMPNDKGTKTGSEGSDAFRKVFQLFQGRDSANSTYKFGVIQEFTPQTKAGWECAVVRVPFERDSIEDVTISANG